MDDIGNNTNPGDPDNWPRRVARAHPRLSEAFDALREHVDDGNERFAFAEFFAERDSMAPAPRSWHYVMEKAPEFARGASVEVASRYSSSEQRTHVGRWEPGLGLMVGRDSYIPSASIYAYRMAEEPPPLPEVGRSVSCKLLGFFGNGADWTVQGPAPPPERLRVPVMPAPRGAIYYEERQGIPRNLAFSVREFEIVRIVAADDLGPTKVEYREVAP